VKSYLIREAARAVVLDEDGNIALLYASLKKYYKLPGGGLENAEDKLIGLQRECREEIGCDIEVMGEIGRVVEYRKMFNLKQISYCYFAHVKGSKGIPEFTESELQDGFEIVWLPYRDALTSVSENLTDDKEGKLYIIPRDTALLKAAEAFLVK
jgi:8-oxo-dGTP pyrophosphatase MutT (NUDIX family)